jgi:hypothetical protein
MLEIKDKLDCLDNFDRIEPLPIKCGEMVAVCSCNDSFRNYCCVESIVFSLLFQPALVPPSKKRSTQLKQKVKEKINPFNAEAVRKRKAEKEATAKVEGKWAPNIPRGVMQAPECSMFGRPKVRFVFPEIPVSTLYTCPKHAGTCS